MNVRKLTIQINKPVSEVFAFTLNPQNTPTWIASIAQEEVNEYPTKVGTIYRNKDKDGNWSEYIVTEFEQDKMFTWTKNGTNNYVRYTFTLVNNNTTQLEYEWIDNGKFDESFIHTILEKLKQVLER